MSDENNMAGLPAGQYGRSEILGTAKGPDLNKRKLVRGAVAAAPVLLTLRSGALAALSCTGAKALTVKVGADGKIDTTSGSPQYALPQPYSNGTGDICYETVTQCSANGQPVGNMISTTAPTNSPGVAVTQNGSDYYCGTSGLNTNTYAILSATSATSLGFTT